MWRRGAGCADRGINWRLRSARYNAAVMTAWTWLRTLDANGWAALGSALSGLATATLVIVGTVQIRSIRKEGRRERTLAICHRYDSDPVLVASLYRLAKLRKTREVTDQSEFETDVLTLLNYLDNVAIGISRGVYLERLAYDHIHAVVIGCWKEYVVDRDWVGYAGAGQFELFKVE